MKRVTAGFPLGRKHGNWGISGRVVCTAGVVPL
jgi:hypothetical protein